MEMQISARNYPSRKKSLVTVLLNILSSTCFLSTDLTIKIEQRIEQLKSEYKLE